LSSNKQETDIYKVDASYKAFPPFTRWAQAAVDVARWDRYSGLIQTRRGVSDELLKRAREIVDRAAAVDTGAIEGLYQTDRGITFTIATQAAQWEAMLDPKARSYFETQLHAYDYVLDFATQRVPIAEAWIRELHNQITGSQDTYLVNTSQGPQEQPLRKGEYKIYSNHVRLADGSVHAYAPVDLTAEEMHRLCIELNSNEFLTAHPILQASYAHYALVVIHPFADGNGRVARALGSVFTYRASSVPLLILIENRPNYLDSLRAADAGNHQPFVDFILERGLDAIRLFDESIRAAMAPSVDDAVAKLKGLFVTKGGYTHNDVDKAGANFINAFEAALRQEADKRTIPEIITVSSGEDQSAKAVAGPGYRIPQISKNRIFFNFRSASPADANVSRIYSLSVPRDCDHDDDFILARENLNSDSVEARITELLPQASPALQMRLNIAAQRIVSEALNELQTAASKRIRGDK
jgi:Fic family protein